MLANDPDFESEEKEEFENEIDPPSDDIYEGDKSRSLLGRSRERFESLDSDEDIIDTVYFPNIEQNLWYVYSTEKNQHQREKRGDLIVKSLLKDIDNEWVTLNRSKKIFLCRSLKRELDYKPRIRQPGFIAFFNYCKQPFRTHVVELTQSITNPAEIPFQIKNEVESVKNDNLFCRKMSLNIPSEHFKVFTTSKSSNGKSFLTQKQLDYFIQRGFCKKDLPKQRFNQAPHKEKLKIQSVFYQFYYDTCLDYFGTSQCSDKYIKLLTDNFIGWDFQNVKNNFKPKIKKRL